MCETKSLWVHKRSQRKLESRQERKGEVVGAKTEITNVIDLPDWYW